MEPNGQLGYELIPDAKPLTVGEFKKLIGYLITQQQNTSTGSNTTIFDEIKDKEHDKPVPDQLQ